MIPGRISGNVTFQNVVHSFAPRSIAASSRWRSKPYSRARTVTTTKLMLNMMWAIRIVEEVRREERRLCRSRRTASAGCAQDDLRRRHRQEDQRVRQPRAAELVADQGERDQRPEDGRDDRRDERDRRRSSGRRRQARALERVEPGVER